MKWRNNLLVGEDLRPAFERLSSFPNPEVLDEHLYLICLAHRADELIEIFSVKELKKEKFLFDDLLILGIASSREEAVDLSAGLLLDFYKSCTSEAFAEEFHRKMKA